MDSRMGPKKIRLWWTADKWIIWRGQSWCRFKLALLERPMRCKYTGFLCALNASALLTLGVYDWFSLEVLLWHSDHEDVGSIFFILIFIPMFICFVFSIVFHLQNCHGCWLLRAFTTIPAIITLPQFIPLSFFSQVVRNQRAEVGYRWEWDQMGTFCICSAPLLLLRCDRVLAVLGLSFPPRLRWRPATWVRWFGDCAETCSSSLSQALSNCFNFTISHALVNAIQVDLRHLEICYFEKLAKGFLAFLGFKTQGKVLELLFKNSLRAEGAYFHRPRCELDFSEFQRHCVCQEWVPWRETRWLKMSQKQLQKKDGFVWCPVTITIPHEYTGLLRYLTIACHVLPYLRLVPKNWLQAYKELASNNVFRLLACGEVWMGLQFACRPLVWDFLACPW